MFNVKFLYGLVLCGVLMVTTGCSLFDNTVPGEDYEMVPGVADSGDFTPGDFNPSDALANSNPEIPSSGWVDPTEEGLAYAGLNGEFALVPGIDFPKIYFGLDMDQLDAPEQAKLDAVFEYMVAVPELYLIVEGHCDERGTNEYNRALGERRAISIKNYLSGKGMDADHIRTISYGEDKPEKEGHDESAWHENRRGVLLAAKKIK